MQLKNESTDLNTQGQIVIFVPTLGLQLGEFVDHYEPLLTKYHARFEPVISPFIDMSRQQICKLAADRGYPYALMIDDDVLLPDAAFYRFINPILPVEFFSYPFKGDRSKITAGQFSSDRFPLHTFPSFDLFVEIPQQSNYALCDWSGAGAMSIRADWLHSGIFFEMTKCSGGNT